MRTHKKKAPPVEAAGAKQISWQDANGSLKNLQPDSSLPNLPMHPAAEELSEWLTVLTGKEAAELKESIKATCIQVAILVTEDQCAIIDGRNRYLAAQELGLKLKDVPLEVYHGKEEDIPGVILSRNVFRRHLTDDQRAAVVARVRGPQWEKEASERMKKGRPKTDHQFIAGSEGSETSHEFIAGSENEEGRVSAKLAKEAQVSEHKARQALKALRAGTLKGVAEGKKTLREAAGKVPRNIRKTVKTIGDRVWTAYRALLRKFTHEEHREVKEHLLGYLEGHEPEGDDGR